MRAAVYDLDGLEKAPPCFDRALERDPCCARAWYNKGVVLDDLRGVGVWCEGMALDDLGRREEALACYQRALELDPGYALAWHSKGYTLFHLGRREEALVCYDRALEIDPYYALAWYNKGGSAILPVAVRRGLALLRASPGARPPQCRGLVQQEHGAVCSGAPEGGAGGTKNGGATPEGEL